MFLFPQGQDSSHSSPTLLRGPSHGTQFSLNISSVGPSHRVQSFRTTLLQHWFPTQSCQETCCSTGSLSMACRWIPAALLSLWAAGWQPASPWSSVQAVEKSLLHVYSTSFLTAVFTDLGAHSVTDLAYSRSSFWLLLLSFSLSLNLLSQRHFHHCWWAWPDLAGIGSVGHGGSFCQLLAEATPVSMQVQLTNPSNTVGLFFKISTVQM